MAPPASNRAGTMISVYQDPDGFVLYLYTFAWQWNLFFRAARWWFRASDPQLLHWTVRLYLRVCVRIYTYSYVRIYTYTYVDPLAGLRVRST